MFVRSMGVLAAWGLFCVAAWGNAKPHCQDFQAPLQGGFCIYQSPGSKNPDVLYHFHGKGGSQHSWAEAKAYTAQIRDYWKAHGNDAPTVISVSFGPIWVLAQKNVSPISGLYEAFTYQVLPSIEKAIGGVRGERILLGESMGGINALQLALKTKLFKKVAALCAPVSELSPFAAENEVATFLEKTSAWAYHKDEDPELVENAVGEMIQLARAFFPTPADWENANPLELVKAAKAGSLPAIYMATGFHDKYAIYEGNQALAKGLKAKCSRLEWRPQWGGHCAMDIPSLSGFLLN